MSATPSEIARRALADHLAALPPAELLKRYATRRDPEAFAGLVQQFGPMVLGTCRRVLGSSADVDDAFQAVFLSLARQADSFRDGAALPAWLHRVALRVSHKALARRADTSAPPEAVADPADPFAEVAWKDVRRVLDEELDALPEKFRGPVVLCWLDGLTQDEAADKLGVSLATLKRRLDAGRELLRSRLVRRGLAPVVAAAAVLDATGLKATVPDALKLLAVELGVPEAAVPTAVEALRVAVVVAPPARSYLKVALAMVLVGGIATAGVVGVNALRQKEPPKPPEEDRTGIVRLDGPEDPLPPGAVARFGTTRFRVPFRLEDATLSPDGTRMAVGGGSSVAVYEVGTWRLVKQVSLGDHRLNMPFDIRQKKFYFSSDGTQLEFATHSRGGTGEPESNLLDLNSGNLQRRRGFATYWPDGTFTLGGDPSNSENRGWFRRGVWWCKRMPSGESELRFGWGDWVVVDTASGRELVTRKGEANYPRRVQLAPDDKTLAQVARDYGEIQLWDTESWQLRATLKSPVGPDPPSHPDGVPIVGNPPQWFRPDAENFWFSADGRRFALRLRTGDIARWDVDTERELPPLKPDARVAGYADLPGGRFTLTPCSNGIVRIWGTATGQEVPVPHRYAAELRGCQSLDGRVLALTDATGRIDLWDPNSGRFLRTLRESGAPVAGLVLNADATKLAYATHFPPTTLGTRPSPPTTDSIRVVSVADGRELALIPTKKIGDQDRAGCPLAFLNNDTQLLIKDRGMLNDAWHTVTWDLATNQAIREYSSFDWGREFFSPDGHVRVTRTYYPVDRNVPDHNKAVGFISEDTLSGKQLWKWEQVAHWSDGASYWLYPNSVAKNGQVVAAGWGFSPDTITKIAIYRPASGFTWLNFSSHLPPKTGFQALVLSPDGTRVLLRLGSGQVSQLWDTTSERLLATLDPEYSDIWFTPDGKSILTISENRGLCYRYDVEKLIAAQKK